MVILFTSGKEEFGRPEKRVFGSAVKFEKVREVPNINNATQNEKNYISF
jgi:hypothetical protein